MRTLSLMLSAALLVAIFSSASQAQEPSAETKVLFDGSTLDGWEGKDPFWSVEDGAITGRTTAAQPTEGNTFLIWRGGEVGDFTLRLKFRIVGGNSGVQYRSQDMGDFVVGGYQADIDASHHFMGILYEERGRGIVALRGQEVELGPDGKKEVVGKTGDEQELLNSLKKEAWNEYVITAKGNQLTQVLNGHVSVKVTDNDADKRAMSGILALQLHAGPPMLVQFKDIELQQLD